VVEVAMKIKTRPTKRSRDKFDYFSECEDVHRLPEVLMVADGYSAVECFHVLETYGKTLPCREPVLLSRAINGKQWHGVTVANCAEDYAITRLLFACEIKANYPKWVQREILSMAAKIAPEKIGFVPTFVKTGDDFTTINSHESNTDIHPARRRYRPQAGP
jgi:hypothetical protein